MLYVQNKLSKKFFAKQHYIKNKIQIQEWVMPITAIWSLEVHVGSIKSCLLTKISWK